MIAPIFETWEETEEWVRKANRSELGRMLARCKWNNMVTADLRSRILKGIRNGESYEELLLLSAMALDLADSSDVLYPVIAEEIYKRQIERKISE